MAIKVKCSDDHTVDVLDEVAMTFMTLLTHRLNTVLRANGMSDPGARQEVCSKFLFDVSYDLDAGWFEEGETRYFPKVCFLERAKPKEGENLGDVKVLHLSNEASSWHEYSHGVVSEYFEECEEAEPAVRTGSYENVDSRDA